MSEQEADGRPAEGQQRVKDQVRASVMEIFSGGEIEGGLLQFDVPDEDRENVRRRLETLCALLEQTVDQAYGLLPDLEGFLADGDRSARGQIARTCGEVYEKALREGLGEPGDRVG